MKKNISKETKANVINLYKNSRKRINTIAKENNILCEEVIEILQEYQELQGDELKRKPNNREKLVSDEEIYTQREKGLSYNQISKYFKDNGKELNWAKVRKTCKKIYTEKNKEVKKSLRENRYIIDDEEIYILREEKLTYAEIAEFFTNQGRKISHTTVRKRCKEIYNQKNEKENCKHRKSIGRQQIGDVEIYLKRLSGYSYKQIAEYFINQGKKITANTVRTRFIEINEDKDKKDKVNEILKNEILKLKETKDASDAQVNKLAKVLKVTLNKEEKEEEKEI